MHTTIYFVRHAHSTYSADERNRPLSDHGQQDAQRVTALLQNENINILLASPYKRAIQTIEGLSDQLGIPITIVEDFKERKLAENPVDNFDAAIARVWEDYSFSWEGGESNFVAQRRGIQALNQVLQQYEGQRVAIGTHGNIMALIMNRLDPRYDFLFWKKMDIPDIYKLTFTGLKLTDAARVWSRS
ncbi:histidine phosphatase family protein [Paenibacillus sp. MMS18-CY102]|uniref:histidine phosphatase family protein n=1 Tax=Paenibacillus sp. MMS18-CY102 TaxID=2682849 RepID=UPI0013660C2B|nr:histidine phosphatase family protein [Paenibacillus sp. MMS18-CY102]MWC27706.1 histidine phosphatase family protein [Paenibacillus sp. MMS18-CY102]